MNPICSFCGSSDIVIFGQAIRSQMFSTYGSDLIGVEYNKTCNNCKVLLDKYVVFDKENMVDRDKVCDFSFDFVKNKEGNYVFEYYVLGVKESEKFNNSEELLSFLKHGSDSGEFFPDKIYFNGDLVWSSECCKDAINHIFG